MKRIFNVFIASFAMLAISAGITSCDKDSIAVAKLLGTWKTVKMVATVTVDGKEVSTTTTLEQGKDEMFKTMTYTSDGKVVATFNNAEPETAEWEYSDGKLTWIAENEEGIAFVFDVDELTRNSLVISLYEGDVKLSYHFKK